MMIEKIKAITQSNPKELTLTGILSLPLRVGERALIFRGYQPSVLTSPVKEILEVSSYGVIFRTCNTLYHLNYTPMPDATEVKCA